MSADNQGAAATDDRGLFSQLSPEQQQAILAYDGPQDHGDVAMKHNDRTTEPTATAYALPTWWQRFTRTIGFRYHLGDTPEGADDLPGWMRTDMSLHFGLADRLRLLASGKLSLSSIVHFDTPSPVICKSRLDWHIRAPGAK